MVALPRGVLDAAIDQENKRNDASLSSGISSLVAPIKQQITSIQLPDLNGLLGVGYNQPGNVVADSRSMPVTAVGGSPLGAADPAAGGPLPTQPTPSSASAQPSQGFTLPSLSTLLGHQQDTQAPSMAAALPSLQAITGPAETAVRSGLGTQSTTLREQSPSPDLGQQVTQATNTTTQQINRLTAPSTANAAPIDNSSRASFVKTAYPYMLQAAGGNTDAAEMMLAAAISENGSVGTGRPFWANNFFGIKGRGDAGSANAATWEAGPNGERQNINDDFAAYSSPVAGFGGFFQFLRDNSRYAPALQRYEQTGDAVQLFRDVNAAGYATDKSWASKVQSIRDNQVAPVVRGVGAAPVAQAQTAGGPPWEQNPSASISSQDGGSSSPPSSPAQMSTGSTLPDQTLMLRQPLSGPDTFQDDQTSPSVPTDASVPSSGGEAAASGPGAAYPPSGAGSLGAGAPPPSGGIPSPFQDDYTDSGYQQPGAPMSQTIPNEDQTSYPPAPQPNGGLGIVDTSGSEQGPVAPAESPLKPLYDLGGRIIGYVHDAAPTLSSALDAAHLPNPIAAAGMVPGAASTVAQEGIATPIARSISNPIREAMGKAPEPDTGQPETPIDRALVETGRSIGHDVGQIQSGYESGSVPRAGLGVLGLVGDLAPTTTLARQLNEMFPKADLPYLGETGVGDVVMGAQLVHDAVRLGYGTARVGGRVWSKIDEAIKAGVPAERFSEWMNAAAGTVDRGIGAAQDFGAKVQRDTAEAARLDAERAGQEAAPAYATLGMVPPEQPRRRLVPVEQRAPAPPDEVRIPRAGYASDLSPGAEEMLRNAPENAPPSQPLSRAEVAQKAQDILGSDPEQVRAWQDEALNTPEDARPVRGEALRQAQYIDAENANRSIDRLRAAQERVQSAGTAGLSEVDQGEVADALLEAAETARAMARSTAADTAQGRAAARELNQRRSAILARQSFQAAERARQVGQDAAFAAQEALRASRTGALSDSGQQRLRIVRAKLADAEANGLIGDGAGGRLDQLEQRTATAQQQSRAQAALNPSVPLGTRIAGEVGSSLGGGVVGAATGAALPADTPEERRRNALIGAGVGMVGAPIGRRIIGRGQGGALGTLGVSPMEGDAAKQADNLMAGVEKRNAQAAQREVQQANQARIRGVVGQIDEVLANPTAEGAVERLQNLHADLAEISQQGFQRSSEIRARLQRNGLLRAGLASKTEDVTQLVSALSRVDPNKPEEMRAVLNIISKPRLIDHLLEYQYVNMLSSPITQGVNITSNALQIAGRLLLQNPLEFAFSGGKSTGVGAAFGGAARGFQEGRAEAGQIMRTGISSADTQRAMELGDYSHVGREMLTEKFGRAGALLHVISTRPLAAMDALLGHVAYASAAEQYAQRTADALVKNGTQAVQGMDRVAARQHVMSNIWDYPDIIKQAGKIEDYTLLRSKDTEGQGWGRVERGLRQLAAVRNPAEDAGFGGQAVSFIANNILPFFNVPLNFAKQGAERTIGAPINAVRAVRAFRAGETERGAELAAKATIGAAAVTTAGVLAAGDNLTGDGPTDPGQRAVWMLTHRPNSFRVPGTSTWLSWEGTPFAIPFGMMAGAREGWTEAQQSAAKKGQAEPLAVAGAALLKGGQGAASGFASQSFIRSLGEQYKLITGQDTGLSTVANQLTSNISRFVPASGMVNWMAQVTDGMFAPGYERDAGKPQSVADLPKNIAAREAIRIPGLREQVDPRLDIYGQPTPNERSGVAGALPYYRGSGVRAGDAITQNLEAAHVGDIATPTEVPAGGTVGVAIPLTMGEQRVFNEAAGQAWRHLLEQNGGADGSLSPMAMERLRSSARQAGIAAALASIAPAERQRRVQAAIGRKAS